MSAIPDELRRLLDEAVSRLQAARRTFTEREALTAVWAAGYEFPIQDDPRFEQAYHPGGRCYPHWRLASHSLANTGLLNALLAGTWDGRDLDRKLEEMEAEDGLHYVYCPVDPRFEEHKGVLEPAERESNIPLSPTLKAQLDDLGEILLTRWREEGAEPWTVHQITETLGWLGWDEAQQANSWLSVRAWLLTWQQVVRVGQDYWLPTELVQQPVVHTRMQVAPVRSETEEQPAGPGVIETETPIHTSPSTKPRSAGVILEDEVMSTGEVTAPRYTWTTCLRTRNLLKGFLRVPAPARAAYPPPAPGEGERVILGAMRFEDGKRFWLWLDRRKHQLYGEDLLLYLQWLSVGTLLRIEWAPDIVVLRQVGHDEEVEQEESRLVDLEALAALRGGLGESYRRALQTLLAAAPNGLTLQEIVAALRERQQHVAHRKTIETLLYKGGFIQKDHRWFAATNPEKAARKLRTVLLETLISDEQREVAQSLPHSEYVRIRVRAIHNRLAEIIHTMSEIS